MEVVALTKELEEKLKKTPKYKISQSDMTLQWRILSPEIVSLDYLNDFYRVRFDTCGPNYDLLDLYRAPEKPSIYITYKPINDMKFSTKIEAERWLKASLNVRIKEYCYDEKVERVSCGT